NWERFVAAAEWLQGRLLGLEVHTERAFPPQTTAVPEVALSWPAKGQRLLFRWYKLTSDWKTSDWVAALASRQRPPLAVIGGNSRDTARALAFGWGGRCAGLPRASQLLLLLTNATADRVPPEEGTTEPTSSDPAEPYGVALSKIYERRTFRFCFTNR